MYGPLFAVGVVPVYACFFDSHRGCHSLRIFSLNWNMSNGVIRSVVLSLSLCLTVHCAIFVV